MEMNQGFYIVSLTDAGRRKCLIYLVVKPIQHHEKVDEMEVAAA